MTTPPPASLPEQLPPPAIDEPVKISWRLFGLMALMMLLASLLLLPYALQLFSIGRPEVASPSGTRVATISTVIQTILLYWPLALLGLFFAKRLGLSAPYLQALAEGNKLPLSWRRVLFPSVVLGFGSGILLLLLAALFAPLITMDLARLNVSTARSGLPTAWQGLLGSISAGINEEILLRLFLLSALAWFMQRVLLRRPHQAVTPAVLWYANILAAIIFGLLHLPNLSAMRVPVTLPLLIYIILLNGISGLGYGWLFWNYGLESAMLAHFFTDLVLHVLIIPLQNFIH